MAAAPSAPRAEYLPALDGLRAIAILLVVIHNVNVLYDPLPGLSYLWGKLVQMGWTGVQLFFVLSGFLITKGLLESRHSRNYYSAFFGRRILRIFPLYYATLVVVFVVWPLLQADAPLAREPFQRQFWYWSFLSNWSSPLGGDIRMISHFWSLAVEEQFYLLWPFIIHRRSDSTILRICGGLVLVALCIRMVFVLSHSSPEYSYAFTFCRMDALAAGAIVAVLYHDDGSREALERNGSRLLMLAATLLVVGELTTRGFYREGPATLTYGHLILDVAFACLVVAAIAGQGLSTRWFQKLLSNAPMRAIGKYSFGMYVIHYPINRYLTRPWMEALQPSRPAGIAYACLMVLISFLLAMASFHLLEKPFLRLRAYFQPLPPATGSA